MSDVEHFNNVYKEMSELVGKDVVMKLWKKYHGQMVSFPQHLYSRDYMRKFIKENSEKIRPGKMAEILNITERRVRQIIKEEKDENKKDER